MSWQLAADNRWERTRKLLPLLKLKYPNDLEKKRLSYLAKVDSFDSHLESIILDAHLNHATHYRRSMVEVKKKLNSVMKKANELEEALRDIELKEALVDIGVNSRGSSEYAGRILEYSIARFPFRGEPVFIPDYIQLLAVLRDAARQAASQRSRRGPKGAGVNSAFDTFIQNLIMAARQRGGRRWTVYRKKDGEWTGTLLEALEVLRPYLPRGFFPPGELGRSVEHIKKKLNDHITKNLALGT